MQRVSIWAMALRQKVDDEPQIRTLGECFNVDSGGDDGCWAEDCWSWNDGPGGGGGGGGRNECHLQSGSYCPPSCMSCTYFYY